MSTTIFVAFFFHFILSAFASAAEDASGPSPPPSASSPFRCRFMVEMLDVNPKFFVTYVSSCGGWSRKAMSPNRMFLEEIFVEVEIFSQIPLMAIRADAM